MDKKVERILNIYNRLLDGEAINKSKEAKRFGVDVRTIQRDIDDIRTYFIIDNQSVRDLVYNRKSNSYMITKKSQNTLTNSEILAVCKILIESRAMVKDEMFPIIDKLIKCCVPGSDFKKVEALIENEKFHYLEPHHGKKFVDTLWNIGNAVYKNKLMRICYQNIRNDNNMRLIQPLGIMFSEFYFYLIAYNSVSEEEPEKVKHSFPTIYRIDRITKYEILEKHFKIPYAERFEEGEFRKRIQFMFGGKLKTVKFIYKGLCLEIVLDRLPTAKVLEHNEKGWVISAEVYGNGIDMWLRSQGDLVEIL